MPKPMQSTPDTILAYVRVRRITDQLLDVAEELREARDDLQTLFDASELREARDDLQTLFDASVSNDDTEGKP